MAPVVEAAHKDKVKVIAYDRIIENADLDYYITFDMLGVGKLQASYLLSKVPSGRYYLLAGDKEDNNARLFRQGQMIVMQPKIDSGAVKVVGDQWAGGWLPENAMKLTENVLTANNNKIDAILASNDSTAQGAIQALKEQGLAGKIPITGQDADLASCQAIVAGRADDVRLQAPAQAGGRRHPAGIRRCPGQGDQDERDLSQREKGRSLDQPGHHRGGQGQHRQDGHC